MPGPRWTDLFYTLTYNDDHLPKYFGIPCFDYDDLRDFLTGGFRKKLLREYGSTFKYFVGAELGDGKGKRGLHNNPHYHALLFIESAHNSRFPYKKITEKELTHLVRLYWQGFDEDATGFQPYEDAKYGMVGISDEGALVNDFRGEKYCAKYVTKDVNLRKRKRMSSLDYTTSLFVSMMSLTMLLTTIITLKRCMTSYK